MHSIIDVLQRNGALKKFCDAHNVMIIFNFNVPHLTYEVQLIRGAETMTPLRVRRSFAVEQLDDNFGNYANFMRQLEEMAAEFDN